MNSTDTRAPFMACDVRGRYPESVDEALFAAIGAALDDVWPLAGATLLAGDLRRSTPSLMTALAEGMGARDVTAMWPVATPLAYFVSREGGYRRTLIVTASHNPPDYNGLKLLHGQRPPTEEELCRLRDASEAHRQDHRAPAVGVLTSEDPSLWAGRYADYLCEMAPATRPLRLVVDAGNGCFSGLAASVLDRAGYEVTEINGRPDGEFPDRGPDPTAPGVLVALAEAVRAASADLGVAFDGDGDRAVFVDESGATVRGDAVAFLLAQEALERRPGAPVVLEIRTSRALARLLEERGGRVVWSYPGHALVRTAMLDHEASFAGETSGHYFFAELGHDDGLYAALQLAGLVSRHGALGTMVAALPQVPSLDEVRVPFVGSPEVVYDALESACPEALVERGQGGLGLQWEGAWALVRPSITEPLLTIRGEADTDCDLARLRGVLVATLRSVGVQVE